jgi:PAS domain S-box-containing protein
MPQVFILSQDTGLSQNIKQILSNRGISCDYAINLNEQKIPVGCKHRVIVVEETPLNSLLDLVLNKYKKATCTYQIIAFAKSMSTSGVVDAMKKGADDYITLDEHPGNEAQTLANAITEAIDRDIHDLLDSPNIYQAVFDNIRDAVYVFSIDPKTGKPGKFLRFNKVALHRLGYSEKELLNMNPEQIVARDTKHLTKVFHRVIEHGFAVYQSAHITKYGKVIPVEISARIVSVRNTPLMISVARNITSQKKLLENLKTSNKRFKSITEKSLTGICILSEDGIFEYVNPSYCDIYGYKKKELLNNHFSIILPEGKHSSIYDLPKRFLNNDFDVPGYYDVLDKYGNKKYVYADAADIKNFRGIKKVVIFVNDFTSTVKHEKELKFSEMRHRAMMEALHDPVFITNKNCEIVFANKAFNIRFGEVKPGKTFCHQKVFGFDERCSWCRKENHGPERVQRVQRVVKDRIYHISEQNITLDNDHQMRMTIMRDVTKVVKARNKAIESDKLKSAFLANISHEIRTPLNAILGFSSLMQQVEIPREEQSKYINQIHEAGNDLLNVIDDIMDFSFLDSGLTPVTLEEFNPKDIVSRVKQEISSLKRKAGTKTINTIVQDNIHPDLTFKSDADKILKIIVQLLRNAFKFTKKGEIKITFNTDPKGWFHIEVSDTGIGIPKDKQKIIFTRFRQGDERITREFGGNGLGLALTKHLSLMLGGKITVASEVGQGSSFKVSLPVKLDDDIVKAANEG